MGGGGGSACNILWIFQIQGYFYGFGKTNINTFGKWWAMFCSPQKIHPAAHRYLDQYGCFCLLTDCVIFPLKQGEQVWASFGLIIAIRWHAFFPPDEMNVQVWVMCF